MANLEDILKVSGDLILGGIAAASVALGADYFLQNQPSGLADLAQVGVGAAYAHYGIQKLSSLFNRGQSNRRTSNQRNNQRSNRRAIRQNSLFDKIINTVSYPAVTVAGYFLGNSYAHKFALDAGEKVTELLPKTVTPQLTNFTSDLTEAGVYAALAGTALYSLNRWVVPTVVRAKDRLKQRLQSSRRNIASTVVNLASAAVIALGGYSVERISDKFIPKTQVVRGYCGVATEGTPEQRALLDTIAWAEGANYNTLYGGRTFNNYTDHPRKKISKWGFTSSAAGRYQFLEDTYDGLRKRGYFSSGFTPEEQDKAALKLVKDEGVTQQILEDSLKKRTFKPIAKRINNIWASIPGNGYGQGTRSLLSLRNKFAECYRAQHR